MITILNLLQRTHKTSTDLSKYSDRLSKELREGIHSIIIIDIPNNINTIFNTINKDTGNTVYAEITNIKEAIDALLDENKFEEHYNSLKPENIEIIKNERYKLVEHDSLLALCLRAIKLPDL